MKVLRSHITHIEKKFAFEISSEEIQVPELSETAAANVGMYSMGENYFAHGSIEGRLALTCDICLGAFEYPVRSEFELYVQSDTGETIPESEDVDIIHVGKQDVYVDLSEFLHDMLLLEIPIQKRCRPDCKGLCSVCGGNLNEQECRHERDQIDPRWAALKDIRTKLN